MSENEAEETEDEQDKDLFSEFMEDMQSQIGPSAGPPRGAKRVDVNKLPDDPAALKQRIQAEQEKLQNTTAIYQRILHEQQWRIEDRFEDLETAIAEEFEALEENRSASEYPQIWDTLSEHGGTILLYLHVLGASYFILLQWLNPTTAGGIALAIGAGIQLLHKIVN